MGGTLPSWSPGTTCLEPGPAGLGQCSPFISFTNCVGHRLSPLLCIQPVKNRRTYYGNLICFGHPKRIFLSNAKHPLSTLLWFILNIFACFSASVFVPYSWRRSQHLELKRGIQKTGRFYREKREEKFGFYCCSCSLNSSRSKATADLYHLYNLSIFKWRSERWASYILKSPGTVSRVVRNSTMKVSSTDRKALR